MSSGQSLALAWRNTDTLQSHKSDAVAVRAFGEFRRSGVGRQWGTDIFGSELAHGRGPRLSVGRQEQVLDPSRRADRQHAALCIATVTQGMDSPAGEIDEGSRRSLDQALAHLDRVITFEHVEGFIERMLVERRSAGVAGRSIALEDGQ